jgi:hypothetical protein
MVCLGLRGIGASLSAAVHGALIDEGIEAQSWTIRPHGHPFDRQPAIDLEIIDAWRIRGSVVLLIDEGPGLSGSSLAGAARFLTDHGFDARDVAILAAWHPDPERFASSSARETWTRHAVITGSFERVRHQVIPYAADWSNISAGRWREHVLNGHVWPPVDPQHERIKRLSSDSRIARFAGLGTYGIAGRERSERLGTAGWTVPPQECQRGFLVSRFVQGRALRHEDVDRAVVERAAAYLAWLRRHEATPGRAQADSLRDMLIVNVREALGDDAATVAARMADAAAGFHEPAVAIDGRVLLHEWIRTPDGLVKVDALDHHRDHFMPGLADIAWDVAGFIVEARLARQTREDLVDRYAAGSGDRSIRARLEFYTAAYLAFRVGYCAMAGHSVCEADERTRFARAEAVYRRQLRVTLRT